MRRRNSLRAQPNKSLFKNKMYPLLLGLLIIFGLALRILYTFKTAQPPLIFDQLEYTKTAIQWIETGIYSYRNTEPNALVTPGYPWFLIVCFQLFGYDPLDSALQKVRIVQAIISAGAIGLIYLLGTRLFHRTVGLVAALFVTFYPTYIWTTSLLTTETLFLTCLLALLYFQVRIIQHNRYKDHIWMGLLLGVTVLIRPNVLPLALVPYLFLWFQHRRLGLSYIAIGVLAFCAAMLPWWIRNAVTFHEFIFIAKGEAGNPFLGGTNPYFRGTIDWENIKEEDQFAEGIRRIKQGFKEDPLLWIGWFTVGKFMVFFKTPMLQTLPSVLPSVFAKLHLAMTWIGWLTLISCRNRSLCFLFVSLLLFLTVHLIYIPEVRYSFGMYPFIMLGAAYCLATGVSWLARRYRSKTY
jgi:4-amino-4-deoxy-L-arabinose transferase-like glycosyltransferase